MEKNWTIFRLGHLGYPSSPAVAESGKWDLSLEGQALTWEKCGPIVVVVG